MFEYLVIEYGCFNESPPSAWGWIRTGMPGSPRKFLGKTDELAAVLSSLGKDRWSLSSAGGNFGNVFPSRLILMREFMPESHSFPSIEIRIPEGTDPQQIREKVEAAVSMAASLMVSSPEKQPDPEEEWDDQGPPMKFFGVPAE